MQEAQYATPSSKWRGIKLGDYVAVKLSDPGINKDVESAEILAASIVPINDGLVGTFRQRYINNSFFDFFPGVTLI